MSACAASIWRQSGSLWQELPLEHRLSISFSAYYPKRLVPTSTDKCLSTNKWADSPYFWKFATLCTKLLKTSLRSWKWQPSLGYAPSSGPGIDWCCHSNRKRIGRSSWKKKWIKCISAHYRSPRFSSKRTEISPKVWSSDSKRLPRHRQNVLLWARELPCYKQRDWRTKPEANGLLWWVGFKANWTIT